MSLVVSGKSVDSGLHQDQSVLCVLVFLTSFHVPSNADCLLDEAVQIFGDGWGLT